MVKKHEALFVYGTLAPGEENARFLAALPGEWHSAWVKGHLYPNGIGLTQGYPALDTRGTQRVSGLVFLSSHFDQDFWQQLDDFEGEGYCRERIRAYFDSGRENMEVWVYALDLSLM